MARVGKKTHKNKHRFPGMEEKGRNEMGGGGEQNPTWCVQSGLGFNWAVDGMFSPPPLSAHLLQFPIVGAMLVVAVLNNGDRA